MARYLLDTNVCVLLLKSHPAVMRCIANVGAENCFVSEITAAELLFGAVKGAEKAANPNVVRKGTADFIETLQVLPIRQALYTYAFEKRRLQLTGQPLDDFDLLIGATALSYNLTMVTNNTKHFNRFQNLTLEDWTEPSEPFRSSTV